MEYIYLDHRDWIELKNRDPMDDTRQAIEQAVESEEIAIPLTNTLIRETGQYEHEEGRKEHFNFISELSQDWVLRPFYDVQKMEQTNFYFEKFSQEYNLSEKVISKDQLHMYGNPSIEIDGQDVRDILDDEIAEELYQVVDEADITEVVQSEDLLEEFISEDEGEKELSEEIDEIRKELRENFDDNSRWRRAAKLDYFGRRVLMPITLRMLSDGYIYNFSNYEWTKYQNQGDEEIENLFQRFPANYSYITLSNARDLQDVEQNPAEESDLYDIVSLAVAIPYCDIVSTERFWVAEARRSGLNEVYNTELVSSIDAVVQLIE